VRGKKEIARKKYPRIQILTVEEIMAGDRIDMPPIEQTSTTFKRAPPAKRTKAKEAELFDS
jgi:hypothetical protein